MIDAQEGLVERLRVLAIPEANEMEDALYEAMDALTRMAGEIERLRRLLWDSYEFIDSERLRDPEYAHHNDRDEFRSRNEQHPILLAKIRAALAEPVGKKP